MSQEQNRTGKFDRRTFMAGTGATALAALASGRAEAQTTPAASAAGGVTGNGTWTYRVVSDWGKLPTGTAFGGTHGGIATDKAGNVYVSTQSETGILVYSPQGALIKTIATQYPEVHSLVYAEENGEEFFYATVQKGTPKENWFFVKMKTDGTPVLKITAPPEAGFKQPNDWKLTAAVPGPDGSIFIANGYGDSRMFRFDKSGNFKASYAGKGKAEGLFDCNHGMSVDTRYDQPLLLICDRANRRLCHYDFDGKFVRTVTEHMRLPCQISFHGDAAVVSELEGRVTVLDKDNTPIAFLGDNPAHSQWANYKISPGAVPVTNFSAAHGVFVDQNANIYVSDWNSTGRITKLERVNA